MASTIAQGTVIKGRISGEGDLEVHGHVEGDVSVTGDLTVGATGLVKSALRGRRIAVAGAVNGALEATEAVVLEAGARVVGDLVAPSIGVREGALVRGRVTTGAPGEVEQERPRATTQERAPARAESAKPAARPVARPEPARPTRAATPAPAPRLAPRPAIEARPAVPAATVAHTPPAPAVKQPPPAPVVPALKRRTEKVKRKGS